MSALARRPLAPFFHSPQGGDLWSSGFCQSDCRPGLWSTSWTRCRNWSGLVGAWGAPWGPLQGSAANTTVVYFGVGSLRVWFFASKHCCVLCFKSFHCVGGCVRGGQQGGVSFQRGIPTKGGLPPHSVTTSSQKPQVWSVFDVALTLNQHTGATSQLKWFHPHHRRESFTVTLPEKYSYFSFCTL